VKLTGRVLGIGVHDFAGQLGQHLQGESRTAGLKMRVSSREVKLPLEGSYRVFEGELLVLLGLGFRAVTKAGNNDGVALLLVLGGRRDVLPDE
jgi:hypothetical protein